MSSNGNLPAAYEPVVFDWFKVQCRTAASTGKKAALSSTEDNGANAMISDIDKHVGKRISFRIPKRRHLQVVCGDVADTSYSEIVNSVITICICGDHRDHR